MAVANQLEHLDSLLLSYLAQTNGDFALAVEVLHTKLIGPVERWREHIAIVGSGSGAGHLPPGTTSTQPLLRRSIESTALQGELTQAAVVTASGRLRTWVRLDTSQQLREVTKLVIVLSTATGMIHLVQTLAL